MANTTYSTEDIAKFKTSQVNRLQRYADQAGLNLLAAQERITDVFAHENRLVDSFDFENLIAAQEIAKAAVQVAGALTLDTPDEILTRVREIALHHVGYFSTSRSTSPVTNVQSDELHAAWVSILSMVGVID